MPISVKNEELLSPRDFRRQFATKLEELNAGAVEKLVLSKRGQFVGVVLTVAEYEDLLLRRMRPSAIGVEIDALADSDD